VIIIVAKTGPLSKEFMEGLVRNQPSLHRYQSQHRFHMWGNTQLKEQSRLESLCALVSESMAEIERLPPINDDERAAAVTRSRKQQQQKPNSTVVLFAVFVLVLALVLMNCRRLQRLFKNTDDSMTNFGETK
jgi:hypothetical protein